MAGQVRGEPALPVISGSGTHDSDEVQKLREKVLNLQKEKNRLDGKLRGYQTLNALFQESKEECCQLKKQNIEFSEKIRDMDGKTAELTYAGETPIGKVDMMHSSSQSIQNPIPSNTIKSENTTEVVCSIEAPPAQDKAETIPERVEIIPVASSSVITKGLSEQVTQDSDVAPEEDMLKFLPSLQSSSHIICVSDMTGLTISSHPATSHSSQLISNPNHGVGSSEERFLIPTQVSYIGPETNEGETQGGNAMSIHVADELTKMAAKTLNLEKSERAWKAFGSTLQSQVQDLKVKLRSTCQEKDITLSALKGENLRLLQKIKQLEHNRDVMSPSDSMSSQTAVVGAGFVHVTKEQVTAVGNDPVNTEDSVSSLLLKLQSVELKNKQLYQANQEWVIFRQNAEHISDQRVQDLREQINASERALTEYKIQDEHRQRDIDKIILTSKRRGQALEEENEDLKTQLSQSKRLIDELQHRLQTLSQQQHEPLNQLSGHVTPVTPSSPTQVDTRYQEVLNEKEALKHQLTVFQEDFINERSDRAKAQSDKDDLNRQLTEVKKNLRRLQNQQKSTEQSLQSSLSENEQLHQQIANLRRQLNMSEESMRKCLEESERLRKGEQELRLKLSRQQDIMRPPLTKRPYYPPYGQQNPGYQEYAGFYQPQPAEPGPELLPGSWQCSKCTFVNYPGRSVCEVCGAVHQQKQQQPLQYMPYHWQMTNQGVDQQNQVTQQLIPRGLYEDDLTCDNGGNIG